MVYAKISTAILCCKNCCGVKTARRQLTRFCCFPRHGAELIGHINGLYTHLGLYTVCVLWKNPEGENRKKAGRILLADLANHIKPAH